MSTTVVSVKRRNGVAGQVQWTAVVDRKGERSTVAFVGDVYGTPGPVVMISESGAQVFVSSPGRFGETFGESWVRRFFGSDGAL